MNQHADPPVGAIRDYLAAERAEIRLTVEIASRMDSMKAAGSRRVEAEGVIVEYLNTLEPGYAVMFDGRVFALSVDGESVQAFSLVPVSTMQRSRP